MRRTNLMSAPIFALTLVVLTACGDTTQEQPQQGPPPEPSSGAPPVDPAGALPPNHPPLEGLVPQVAVPAVPLESGTGAQGLAWDTPEGWIAETPTSNMRRAQYRLSGGGGDAECVVYYFGPGQGGDATANALRWAEQFAQPDGRPSSEALESSSIEVGGIPVLLTSITGTYGGGSMTGAAQRLTDHMLLGAIAEGPDSNWFFKLTGPEKTLRENQAAFDAMIRSLRAGE